MSPKPRSDYYSSPLSAYCADVIEEVDFHYLDGDEVMFRHSALPMIYARETGILRILESKHPGEEIRRSQRETFPLLAAALQLATDAGVVRDGSGVFIVEGEYPFSDGALVRQVRPASARPNLVGLQFKLEHDLTALQFKTFMRCRKKAA
jgi:hypothetical protein